MGKLTWYGAGVMLLALAGCAAFAQTPAPPLENIALNAVYTMAPKPAYKFCTDAGDAKQLTDGVYSEGYFWTQPSTVGWQNSQPVIVTLDLGKELPIRGASYNTAAGAAGVEWPVAVYVFVAGEDRQFREAGELVGLSAARGLPAEEKYAVHRYWTDALQTHGRYVAIAVWGQPYVFCDEIEVYGGEAAWLNAPVPGEAVPDIKAFTSQIAVREAVRRRFRADIQALREKAEREGVPKAVRKAAQQELEAIEQEVGKLPLDFGEDFRAVLPLNPLHARVFAVQAALWRAAGNPALCVWPADPLGPLSHLEDPAVGADAAVTVAMMQNEYRAGAFNLANAGEREAEVTLKFSGLPGGEAPDYITVHEVAWTDTSAGQPVAAALPEAARAAGGYRVSVPAGMTRQVWLTFHPAALAAGEYAGEVQLASGDTALRVPVSLRVYPLRFPDLPRLHLGGWDYTNVAGHYEVTPENRALLIAHLREHFVDSPWATSAAMPRGEYGADGNMVKNPDTSNFDDWIALWPGARQYLVFASVSDNIGSWKMNTPEFDKAVQAWAVFWARHAASKGVKPEQIGLLLVDEPKSPEQDAIILAWAKALHAADTGIRVWEDPIYTDMTQATQEMVAECDVLCPNRPIFLNGAPAYRAYFAQQRTQGIALEFYSCSGPVRLLDPYRYYRLQGWDCWRYGAEASYFWAFADAAGASSWNEYATARNAYTPLFIDATTVTAGKHLEACREGMEDYEYLMMLQEAVDAALAAGKNGAAVEQARTLLSAIPERVCDTGKSTTFRWRNDEIDRTAADRARVEILEALVALSESSGQ